MTDVRVRIETAPGSRAPSSVPERAVIVLALVALVGGALIVVGNLLPPPSGVANVSPTPTPSAPDRANTRRSTSTPRQLREVRVEPMARPIEPEQMGGAHGWVRAIGEVPIRAGPDHDALEAGRLAAGEVSFAFQSTFPGEAGWLYVAARSVSGFVWIGDGEGAELEFHAQGSGPVSGQVWDVTAGDSGFMALGALPSGSGLWRPLVAVSEDGASWRESQGLGDLMAVAWGPAGWIGVSGGADGRSIWLSRSPDGLEWESLGLLRMSGYTHPTVLVGSRLGYLLRTESSNGRDNRTHLWFSRNGVTWHESADVGGLRQRRPMDLAATGIGFLAWESSVDATSETARVHFSSDGRAWSETAGGPGARGLRLAGLAGGIVAIDTDPGTGAARVWTAALRPGGLAWHRHADGEPAFAGANVTALVSDGERAIVLGWDRSTEEPRVWTGTPTRWTSSSLPESFGGMAHLAAAGPTGVVAIGYRPTLRGENPIFWHLRSDGTWAPEADPILELAANPSLHDCPAPPADALEWIVLDRPLAVVCFGGQPISFEAWSIRCSQCYGVPVGKSEPAWLAAPERNHLHLAPVRGSDVLWTEAILAPGLEPDRGWTNAWIEVTGHFDDPAAATCRWIPDAGGEAYFSGQSSVVNACRQRFVVTDVRLANG